MTSPFLEFVDVDRSRLAEDDYSLSIPAIAGLERFELHPKVTYFIGENGTEKSTLLEAIAVAIGFNPEVGSRNSHFSTRESHCQLWRCLRLGRGLHPERRSDGNFSACGTFLQRRHQDRRARRRGLWGEVAPSSVARRVLFDIVHGTFSRQRFLPL
jgi:predicted ATPase